MLLKKEPTTNLDHLQREYQRLDRLRRDVEILIQPMLVENQDLIDEINKLDHEYRLLRTASSKKLMPVLLSDNAGDVPVIDRLSNSATVDISALRSSLRERSRHLRQKYHADRHVGSSPAVQAAAAEIWSAVHDAIKRCDAELLTMLIASESNDLTDPELETSILRVQRRIRELEGSQLFKVAQMVRSAPDSSSARLRFRDILKHKLTSLQDRMPLPIHKVNP